MSNFEAKRVTRTYAQKIEGSPDEVFPLLCPVREREWLEGWSAEMVYSLSGFAEQGCIFKTRRHGETEDVWVMTRHEPASVEFAVITPGFLVGQVQIRLEANSNLATTSHITYTFTALGEKGNSFIDGFTEEEFNRRMQWWEKSMNHFLKTGELLRSH
ncbi:MAG TPA: hypothetical protein VID27_03670 [Blastocatellia bacterium]